MTDKDKLAEEILDKIELKDICMGEFYYRHEVIEAMQAYHEAKMKEVMDEDIERESHELYVDGCKPEFKEYADSILSFVKSGYVVGAKAMRDGKIKHVSRDND